MPRESVGSRSKYAQSMIPCHVRHFQLVGPDAWPAEIARLHNDFCQSYYDKPKIGTSEFLETVGQVLTATGADPKIIAEFRLLSKSLAQIPVPVPVGQSEVIDEIDQFMDDLDLNEAPPPAVAKSSITSPLRAEMHGYVRHIASKWAKEEPFFCRRSEVNPAVMLIPSSVGVSTGTGVKTNLNCAIGNLTLSMLGSDHLLYENDSMLVESHDHDGRTYYVRAFRILPGTTVRLFLSELTDPNDPRSWKQINQKRIAFNPALPHGCTISG